jgi:hypothetical protein
MVIETRSSFVDDTKLSLASPRHSVHRKADAATQPVFIASVAVLIPTCIFYYRQNTAIRTAVRCYNQLCLH